MKSSNTIKIKGHWKFIVRNIITGEKRIYEYDNLVPTVGRTAMATQIAGNNTQEMQAISIEIGTGTNAPANGDTALQTPTHRKAIGSGANVSNVATISVNYSVADLALGATTTFREAGLIGHGNTTTAQATTVGGTGILYSRVAINVSVSVVEELSAEFTYTFS